MITEGARVGASEPLREAADELVRQGQRYMDDRRALAVQQEAPKDTRGAARRHLLNIGTAAAYGWGLGAADSIGGQVAMHVTMGWYLATVWNERRELRAASDHRLDPAQAQLRSVRTDLISNLDGPSPVTRHGARALRNPNRPTGPSR